MRAPEFWNHVNGPAAAPVVRTLLAPVSWAYLAGAGLRRATTSPWSGSAAVICVGNITVGGAGKTPVAAALMERLAAKAVPVAAVSRGYLGRLRGPVLVDPARHSFADVGDEPLLLARAGRTIVAKSKRAGVKAAIKAGAQAVVLDDGLQNPSVLKHFSFVLIDAVAGLGNGRVIPAGPLREAAGPALARADAIVIMNPTGSAEERAAPWRALIPRHTPVLEARFEPVGSLPAGPIVAFAGIGRPAKFFESLIDNGVTVRATLSFPDHHAYTDAELKNLREWARKHNAFLVTTEKDAVRLPPEMQKIVNPFAIRARFSDDALLDHLLERALDRALSRPRSV